MNVPADALIVGAGIVGAACAEALAEAGVRVRVLDRAAPAGMATAAGMGHVLVLDDSEAQLQLTKLSRAAWDARASTWPASVERDGCGTIWVAADDEEFDAVLGKHAWYAARDVATEILDAAGLYAHEPNLRPGLRGGLRVPGDSVVYPPAAARAMLDRAIACGATVDERIAVRHCGDGFVDCEDGTRIEAAVVVVAAGIATPDLVDVDGLVVRPKKGHLAITERCPGFIHHQLVELGYLKSAHGGERTSVAFNAQPRATGQVLLGSSRQIDVVDRSVEPAILARMIERAFDFLPRLRDVQVTRTWVGFRPSTPDNLPVIGPVPDRPGLWLATGHEGVGITTSLGTARLLADQMLGRTTPIDPTPFRVERLGQEVHHG